MALIQPTPSAKANEVSKRKGFTLTEIAIVLGIVGLILGAIWTAASSVYANQRQAHAQTAILQLAQGIKTLYATAGTDLGLNTTNLITAGAVPTDLIAAGGATLNSPFPAGATVVKPTNDGLGFVISMTRLPQSACIGLMMAIAGQSRDPSLFLAIAPNAPTVAQLAAASPAIAGVMSPAIAVAALTTQMQVAGDGGVGVGGCTNTANANTISFGFGLK